MGNMAVCDIGEAVRDWTGGVRRRTGTLAAGGDSARMERAPAGTDWMAAQGDSVTLGKPCGSLSAVKRLFFMAKNSLASKEKAAVMALDFEVCNGLNIRGLRRGR